MRESFNLARAALCAGRPPRDIAARLIVAVAMAATAWAAACAFLMMEPQASAPAIPHRALSGCSDAPECPQTGKPISYGLLQPLSRQFGGQPIPVIRKGDRHA